MDFRIITDEQEFARLWQLRDKRVLIEEQKDFQTAQRIVSEMCSQMKIVGASTFREARILINECLSWSSRLLWLKEIGAKPGMKVIHDIEFTCRPAEIIELLEYRKTRPNSVRLRFDDGKKPRTGVKSAYQIQPADRIVDTEAFLKRIRGEI